MDPAGDPAKLNLRDFFQELARQRDRQEQMLQFMNTITTRLDTLSSAVPVQAPPTPLSAPYQHSNGTGVQLPLPSRFDGNPKACRGFLNQCQIHFQLHAQHFPSDQTKVAFIISLLSDEALAWANPIWERGGPEVADLTTFLNTFRAVFEEPGRVSSASSALLRLRQGNLTVGQYAIQFRILASELAWNNEALVAAFWEGLSTRIKDELAGRDRPATLDSLISLASRIDMRFQERAQEVSRERRAPRLAPTFQRPFLSTSPRCLAPSAPVPAEVPMQVERIRLSDLERQRRRRNNLCLYCGGEAHYVRNCPQKSENSST